MRRSAAVVGAGALVVISLTATLLAVTLNNSNSSSPDAESPTYNGKARDDTAEAEFNVWMEAYLSTRSAQRSSSMLASGAELAIRRRDWFEALIKSDPEEAINRAINPITASRLPDVVKEQIETLVEGEATIEVLCPYQSAEDIERSRKRAEENGELDEGAAASEVTLDGHERPRGAAGMPAGRTSPEYYHTVDFGNGAVYSAYTWGRRFSRPFNKAPVSVWGVALGKYMAMSQSPLRDVTDEELMAEPTPEFTTAAVGGGVGEGGEQSGGVGAVLCPMTGKPADPNIAAVLGGGKRMHFASHDDRVAYRRVLEQNEDASVGTRAFLNDATLQPLATIVIVVKFSNKNNYATTENSFDSLMDTVIDYWDINSYGLSSYVNPIEYAFVELGSTSSYSGGSCPILYGKTDDLDNDAWTAAEAQGYNEADFDRYILVFSAFDECEWAGLGSVAGVGTWINGRVNPEAHWHVTAHELGHNYGLKHANLWPGSSSGPISGGTSIPYGDDWDIMGAVYIDTDRFTFHVNTEKKWGLEWIPDEDVTAATASGSYRVYAHDEKSATGNRAVTVRRGSEDIYYWIEYRTALDYSAARAFFLNGATIHLAESTSGFEYETNLLDMTPSYAQDSLDERLNNCPLELGTTFGDPDYDIYLTPTLIASYGGQSYLDVVVKIGESGGNSDPVISDIVVGCTKPETEEAILFTADVTDADLDQLAYSWDFGDGNGNPANSRQVAYAWSTVGAKTVTLTVSDMRGGTDTMTLTDITVVSGGNSKCDPCPASCNYNGICAGSLCSCNPGWTGADCGTPLTISKLRPNFGVAAGGMEVTVTGAGFDESNGGAGGYVCNFEGIGYVSATRDDATTVRCTAPTAPQNMSVVVEVSPNGGIDFSGSDEVFTYGGGYCPYNCTLLGTPQGTCDRGPGICTCFAGFTGPDCHDSIFATGLNVTQGPTVGGTVLAVYVTGFPAAYTTAPACRFGTGIVVSGSYSAAAGTVTCVTPEYGYATGAAVEVSPNGKDWTTGSALTFNYRATTVLISGQQESGTSLGAGELVYYVFDNYDSGTEFTITKSGGGSLYVRFNVVPEPAVDVAANSWTFSSNPSSGESSINSGRYYVAVEGAAAAYTLDAVYTASVELETDGNAVSSAIVGSGSDQYTVQHSNGNKALVVAVDLISGDAPTIHMGKEEHPAGKSDAFQSGKFVTLQYCDKKDTYYLTVDGTDAVYSIYAFTAKPPTPYRLSGYTLGEIVTLERNERSFQIQWPYATDDETNDFDLTYAIYYRGADIETEFNTPCLVLDTAESNNPDGTTADPFYVSEATVDGLKTSTNYEINILVCNSWGICAVMDGTAQRTKPPALPQDVIIMLVAATVSTALFAGAIVAYLKFSSHGRRHRKKKGGKHRRRHRPKTAGKGTIDPRNPATSARAKKSSSSGKGKGPARNRADPRNPAAAAVGKRKGGPRADGRRKERRAMVATGGAQPGGPTGGALPGGPAAAALPSSSKKGKAKAKGKTKSKSSGGGAGPSNGAVKATVIGIALSDFAAQYDNELPFKKGDYITLLKDMKNGWLRGELHGRVGLVPSKFVKKVKVVDKSANINLY